MLRCAPAILLLLAPQQAARLDYLCRRGAGEDQYAPSRGRSHYIARHTALVPVEAR